MLRKRSKESSSFTGIELTPVLSCSREPETVIHDGNWLG
jgi:hypothetical protein